MTKPSCPLPSKTHAHSITQQIASTLPKGRPGDVFFLRNILHDWSDADATAILKVRARIQVMKQGAQADHVPARQRAVLSVCDMRCVYVCPWVSIQYKQTCACSTQAQALHKAIGDSGAALLLLEMSPKDDLADPLGFSRYQMDVHMMAM